MEDNEFEFIHEEIKKKLDKPIKELKKVYQATIDGDGSDNFHSRCDCIPNLLVLVKTAGNRRFGGFTSKNFSLQASGHEHYVDDKKAFLFSLDKKQIYPYKNSKYAINSSKYYGPYFGENDFRIGNHPIYLKQLFTCESDQNSGYDFKGDKNALSEDGESRGIQILEYEAFQVVLESYKD